MNACDLPGAPHIRAFGQCVGVSAILKGARTHLKPDGFENEYLLP